MNEYDVVVIGAGPGGYVCAIRSAQLGMRTAIVEKQWLGGVCLNVGCIPTKALLKNAELAHTLRERSAEFGISLGELKLDYAAAVKRSRQVSDRLTKGVAYLLKKNSIDVLSGTGRILSKDRLEITDSNGDTQQITCKHIVIATGAHVSTLPGVTVDGKRILSYQEAILQEHLPVSVVIVGAGAIGVEFATIWSSFGVQVTLVEMLPRVLPLEDEEIGLELGRAMQKRHIQVLTGAQVRSIQAGSDDVTVQVEHEGNQKTLTSEQVLIATGFKPNTSDMGLEQIGVGLDRRSFIQVNEHMRTNLPGVWAVGDVTGQLLLAHVASAQGILCAESIAGQENPPLDYTQLPRTTFSQPQVASFGLSEAQARERGLTYKTGRFNFIANGKALGLAEGSGFVKLLVDPAGKLLGAHLIGPDVCELLPELTLAQQNGLSVEAIARNVHSHPTLGEAVQEAAHAAIGRSIQS
jgi:dihydrolipoamide dehydrogenase